MPLSRLFWLESSMDENQDPIYSLALNCSRRRLPSNLFVNFYNELVNEKYGSMINSGEETDADIKQTNVCEKISSSLLRLLDAEKHFLIVDYVVEVLFINYNKELVKELLPQLYSIKDSSQLVLFLSKASAFFLRLTDKLVIDQICGDLGNVIVPSILPSSFNTQGEELIVAIAKFLRNVLSLSSNPIAISDPKVGDRVRELLNCLSKINRLLYKKVAGDFDSLLRLGGSAPPTAREERHGVSSPSIISPRYLESPINVTKQPQSLIPSSVNHQTVKLARYCKNLWLNSKIMGWRTNDVAFVTKYSKIEAEIMKKTSPSQLNVEAAMKDLIETAFTSFAQFVSNKQYHQANSAFNLLERQWNIFITKQLPLHIMENASDMPHIVINALENIDHKVVKALKSYASDKDDAKNRGEDLFDDLPNKNTDIRHDFLKSLIMIGLQPAAVLNDFLREDQVVDTKSLPTNDTVVIKNAQGVKETVDNFSQFIKDTIEDLDAESMFEATDGSLGNADNGIMQILRKFETLAATKQKDLANVFYDLFRESVSSFDCKTFSKTCCLMCFNMSHSLTTMFAFVNPQKFLAVAIEFVDQIWESSVRKASAGLNDESDFEPNTEFVCFTYALIFIVQVVGTYNVSLIEALSTSSSDPQSSFIVNYITKLGDIAPALKLNSTLDSSEVLKSWVRDLFINGSISDSLMKSANVKDLAVLIPFIFKESLSAVESGSIRDISALVGGFEYFLQPFLIVGLIGIVFWTEQYLTTLRSKDLAKDLLESIFDMLNSVLNPSTLNDESRPLHTLILRLNTVQLLKATRAFQTQTQSSYGTYSSDSEGSTKVDSLISHLEQVARSSILYNVDSSVINSEIGYQRKDINYTPFAITADNSINSILTNQVNSFWNLHSSTYYNIDYLFALIDIITPQRFLEDMLVVLQHKATDAALPNSRTKGSDGENLFYLDYFFYFLVSHDVMKAENKTDILQYMSSTAESDLIFRKPAHEFQPSAKVEQPSDEDFDMLFGEDTSIPGNESEANINEIKADEISPINPEFLRCSFAAVLHCSLLANKAALESGHTSEVAVDQLTQLHDKYIEILKSSTV